MSTNDNPDPAGDPTPSEAEGLTPTEPVVEPEVVAPEPASTEPTVEAAATEPVTAEPSTAEPVAAEPVESTPAAESVQEPAPAADAPAAGTPASETPAAETPVSDTPASDTPAAAGAPSVPSGPPPPPGSSLPAAKKPKITDAGKIVSGIVTDVGADELSLTLEDGRAAVLARRHWDLEPIEDLTKVVSVNDRVDAAILARDDPKGRVVLSRSWSLKKKAWDAVTSAVEDHTTVKATVSSMSAKGIVVDVNGLRGFVPASHLSLEPKTDFREFAGQTLELRVLEADQRKERLVLSKRSMLLREQRKEAHDLLTSLKVDSVVTGTVASLADYGAFVELGGVKGLVHLSELSWHRVGHPRDVVTVGDTVEVKVLDVKVKKRRVSLSIRQVAPDPFAGIAVGSVVNGPVTRLVDFGAFVDLGGVEGLVHLSELAEYRVSAPEEIVTPGEDVMVKVLSIDKRRRRIELSIRQAVSDQYSS